MSNVAISKKSIIDAAVVIANELQVAANNATQTYNNHYQNGTHTKADKAKEGANKRGNSSRLTQPFHFFMFEPIFSPVNALNQPI